MHVARQPNHRKVSDSTGGDDPDRRETRQRAWAIPRFSMGWFHVIDLRLRVSRAGRRRAWLFLKDEVSPDQVGQALQALAR